MKAGMRAAESPARIFENQAILHSDTRVFTKDIVLGFG